jgi:hypothetical protein
MEQSSQARNDMARQGEQERASFMQDRASQAAKEQQAYDLAAQQARPYQQAQPYPRPTISFSRQQPQVQPYGSPGMTKAELANQAARYQAEQDRQRVNRGY